MAVVALRVLEGGLLSSLRRSEGAPSEMLQALGKDNGDIASVAVRFALSNADLATVLIGFSDEHQVRRAPPQADKVSPMQVRPMPAMQSLMS